MGAVQQLEGLGHPPAFAGKGVLEAWRTRPGEYQGPPRSGDGRRMIRRLLNSGACCPSPHLGSESQTGRQFCSSCHAWWTASHTPGCLAVARCSLPVGIDVQRHVRRPAALRWLARTAGLPAEASIAHWAIAEAYWKASGNAVRKPEKGEFSLPDLPVVGWGRHAFDGVTTCDYWLRPTGGLSMALVLAPTAKAGTTGPSRSRTSFAGRRQSCWPSEGTGHLLLR